MARRSRRSTSRHALATLLLLVLGGILVACIAPAPACEDLPSTLDLVLDAEGLEPSDPSVCSGADVTLSIDSRVDGVFHIHGYDAEVPAAEVVAGETLELRFAAERSGQFPIEFHAADDPEGVNVGLFTVHER